MLFGNIMPQAASLPFQINLVSGEGGGHNDGINTITCNIYQASTVDGLPSVVAAELAEIFMTRQAKGWIENWSNGEALSRVAAQILYPNISWLWCTGNAWLQANPRPDWVDAVEQSDQDILSYGCGSLFLNYLAYQLNYRWPDIIGAGAPSTNTLSETAMILGEPIAFSDFSSLLARFYPIGTQVRLQTDDPFPLGEISLQVPILYVRHNLADDGTSHIPLSSCPDIIVTNNSVADPQATFSTPASIGSALASNPDVLDGQANYVYLRVWNRGADAANVFAAVYWSRIATLVTPNMWNLIGTAYYPDVQAGRMVQVSNPGIIWPADKIPGLGHYCFVATVGNVDDPVPDPASFVNFNDYVNYIATNNNITWRNFEVLNINGYKMKHPFGGYVDLPFLISGAWDEARVFTFETIAELPAGSQMALQVAGWFGRGLKPAPTHIVWIEDPVTDPNNPLRARIPLQTSRPQLLGTIELPPNIAAASHLLVKIPAEWRNQPFEVAIRQMYEGREVGRITWKLV